MNVHFVDVYISNGFDMIFYLNNKSFVRFTMKLFYQTHSPYARKVLVLAYEKNISVNMEVVHMETSPTDRNVEVFALNPLGKVPVLVDKDEVIFESSVICEYLDKKYSQYKMIPDDNRGYLLTKKLEALATGIADAGILARWEIERRPVEKRYQQFLDGQLLKLSESYKYIENNIVLDENNVSLGEIALATTLSWIEYVKLPSFKEGHPKMFRWYNTFSKRPSMLATAYSGTTQDIK